MITSIHYKNFKALQDATLPLGRFTLIVGANGTGKSTALQALAFMGNPNKNDFDKIVSANVKGFQDNVKLTIVWNSLDKYIVDWISSQPSSEKSINKNFTRQGEAPTEVNTQQQVNVVRNFRLFNFDSKKIAYPVSIQADTILEETGEGLAGVLDQLRDSEPERFEELNNELNHWFYEYDRILFEVPADGQKSFLLRTTVGKHKIKASELSDGTLLALAYLTIAYLPNPPKIVAFEEPERGIHPRLLRNIQEAMYRLAYPENFGEKREPIQVIATTHSPYLLDLYKDNPEEIVIAEKDERGVHFENLAKMKNIDKILQGGESLGEVWFTGVLGGVPAHV